MDVEVSTEEEANEAIEAGADVIMLDNMHGDLLVSVARRLKEKWNGKRKFLLETSGGIEEGNLREHAINCNLFVPFVSQVIEASHRNRYPQHQRCSPRRVPH